MITYSSLIEAGLSEREANNIMSLLYRSSISGTTFQGRSRNGSITKLKAYPKSESIKMLKSKSNLDHVKKFLRKIKCIQLATIKD